jgi:FkbM family methyltransferase
MKFYYGTKGNYCDITNELNNRFKNNNNNVFSFPNIDDETRFRIFLQDTSPGFLKHILAVDNNGNKYLYASGEGFTLHDEYIFDKLEPRKWWNAYGKYFYPEEEALKNLQNKLKITNGNFQEEYEEQLMTLKFLKTDSKVLELGSNIGRNTLVIGTILDNIENFVTLESSKHINNQLRYNCDINNLHINIENKALSYRNLIQNGWDTIPSDELLEGYNRVDIINYEDLEKKYNIKFDTIIADCEGALYYVFLDNPSILNNIHTLIMENDYKIPEHKTYVENLLIEKGFTKIYTKECNLEICLQKFPHCANDFFVVWRKN